MLLTMLVTVALVAAIYPVRALMLVLAMVVRQCARRHPKRDRPRRTPAGSIQRRRIHSMRFSISSASLSMKPDDRFTAAKAFFEYGKLVAQDREGFRYRVHQQGCGPQARGSGKCSSWIPLTSGSITMRSSCDGALRYEDGFPDGRTGNRLQVPPPDMQKAAELGCAAEYRRQLPDQVQGGGPAAERSGRRIPVAVLSQRAVSLEPGARGRSHSRWGPWRACSGLGGTEDLRHRQRSNW